MDQVQNDSSPMTHHFEPDESVKGKGFLPFLHSFSSVIFSWPAHDFNGISI